MSDLEQLRALFDLTEFIKDIVFCVGLLVIVSIVAAGHVFK